VKIIDLREEHQNTYFACLETWNEEVKEGLCEKRKWYEFMKDKGLRVKLAQDDNGDICGMIQYIPSEYSFVNEKGYYVVKCIWVHGYKEGVGDFQKKGIGKQLLKAAEEDSKNLGAKGLIAWGIVLPFFMRAGWFKKSGYTKIDHQGQIVLLWKAFEPNIKPPKMIKMKKKPYKESGKISIMAFVSGWCTGKNITFERVMKAAKEFEEYVDVEIYDTKNSEILEEWGIFDDVFIDGKVVQKGPPPTYKKIHSIIESKVEKMKKKDVN